MSDSKLRSLGEVRLVVTGRGFVGKSWLTQRYLHPETYLPDDFTVEWEDSYRKQIAGPEPNTIVLVDILDTQYNEEFSAMHDRYYRMTDGVIIVYSVTNRASFEDITEYYEQTLRTKDVDEAPMVIVANKCDLDKERVVTTQEGYALATKLNLPYYEISAKTIVNINEVFENIINQSLNYKKQRAAVRNKRAKKNSLFTKKAKSSRGLYDGDDIKDSLYIPKAKLFSSPSKVDNVIVVPNSSYEADFQQMYEEMDFADVKFITNDNETVMAHAFVIAARCKQLWNILKSSNNNELPVAYSSLVINTFVKYLYTEKFNECCDDELIRNQLVAAAREWKAAHLLKDLYAKYKDKLSPDPTLDPPMPDDSLLTASERSLSTLNREMRRALVAPSSDKANFDVIFNVKTAGTKVIKAHKALLSARSAYFRAMFTGGTKERNAPEVDIEDVQLPILLAIIEYCYTDDIRYVQDDMVSDLLVAAGRFCLSRLSRKMEAYILSGVTRHNVVEVYTFARDYEATELKEKCIQIIARWTKWLTANSPDFSNKKKISKEELTYFDEIRNKWVGADQNEEEELRIEAAYEAKQLQNEQQIEANNANPNRCVLQ